MKTKKSLPSVVIVLAALLTGILTGFLAERLLRLPVLLLPANEQGIYEVAPSDLQINENLTRDGDALIWNEAGNGLITFDLGGRYVDKLRFAYETEGLMNAAIYVDTVNDYGIPEEGRLYPDFNAAGLSSSVVNIGAVCHQVTIRLLDAISLADGEVPVLPDEGAKPFRISDICVLNDTGVNLRLVLFFAVIVFLGALFVWPSQNLFKRPALLFFVTSMLLGSLMIALMPPTRTSWDEEMHFERSYAVSIYPRRDVNNAVLQNRTQAGIMTWHEAPPASVQEAEQLEEFWDNTYLSQEPSEPFDLYLEKKLIPSYLGPGVAMKAARYLGLPFSFMYRAGRFGNLFVYSLLLALAIYLIPVGKRILIMLGLMPTPLFLACSFSYDTMVTAGLILAEAAAIRFYLTPERKLEWGWFLLALLAAFAGALGKAVYAPLLLVFFLIPKEKFQRPWMVWIPRVLSVLAFLALVYSFMAPASTGVEMADPRGGATSTVGQMSYVLGQPFVYAKVLLANIWNKLPGHLMGHSALGETGYLGSTEQGRWIPIIVTLVVLTDTFRDRKVLSEGPQARRLGVPAKVFLFILCAMAVALVFTSMYLAYTEVGAYKIAGVQGRYMIPLLLPLYLIINQPVLENKMEEETYTRLVFVLMLAVQALLIWGSMASVFAI